MKMAAVTVRFRRFVCLARRLRADRSGVSMMEFALILPILLTFGLYGTELAYMAVVKMEVAQLSTAVADNASRLGQTDNSAVTPTVTETQINSVMSGALTQGNAFNFNGNGRIILSSLEKNSSGNQYIHWQRCRGNLARTSAYGVEGTTLTGMGKTGHLITATTNSAVMYVEVYFAYQPLFGTMFVKNTVFYQESAFLIRDDRSLSGVTGTGKQSNCI
ncbi:pilus assembly protein TadE [Novosphingobium sp. BL-8A]|uniref:TadE/TadG family type IV pilus assembly protein n=1 Tax=Novosphingobium sp. BL-8A TaxID=3127639 RepID=UPI003757F410